MKTGPKTKFNNFSFNQPILKSKVPLEYWDIGIIFWLLFKDDVFHVASSRLDANLSAFFHTVHDDAGDSWTNGSYFGRDGCLQLCYSLGIITVNPFPQIVPKVEIQRRKIWGPWRPFNIAKPWKHFSWKLATQEGHVLPRSVTCGTVLLEMDVCYIHCFELWYEKVVEHLMISLRINCYCLFHVILEKNKGLLCNFS